MLKLSTPFSATVLPFARTFCDRSWLSIPGNPLMKWPQIQTPTNLPARNPDPPPPQINHDYSEADLSRDSAIISRVLNQHLSETNPQQLESALSDTEIKPRSILIQKLLQISEFSSTPIHNLLIWAEKQPGYTHTRSVFNSAIDLFAKMREFDRAWLLIDRFEGSSLLSIDTFTILIRRYARANMAECAIRTFELMESWGFSSPDSNSIDILLDALCKEGQVRVAARYFEQRKNPNWIPSTTTYNILLNGWLRWRKLRNAERLWEEMQSNNVAPSVVTYGTLIEGYCRMRRVKRAIELLEEMKKKGINPNIITYNPIIDALGEDRMFKQALEMLDSISTYGLIPTISTFNSLVKGFCKAGDLVGASKILKMMIGKGCLPTATTYNYFFRFFSRFGRIDEGMNLYTKMIDSGYAPDRLTYQLIIKMLCEKERLDLAVQMIREMNARGFDSDLATSTMLIHLLCKLRRFEEACGEFEEMISRGITPQYLTYQKLVKQLKRSGMGELSRKISDMMAKTRHSMKLPHTFEGEKSRELRSSIMKRARVMADVLKTCRDPNELRKLRNSNENSVESANQLIDDIRSRVYAM